MPRTDIRKMVPSERTAVLDLLEHAFGMRTLFAQYLDHDPRLGEDDTWLAVQDGRVVSCVQIFSRTLRLRGQAVELGGIGSVATAPEARGQRLASQLIERALDDMRGRGMPLALLFAERHAFYARHGFVAIERPLWTVRRPKTTPVLPGGTWMRDADDSHRPALAEIHADYGADFEALVLRDAEAWSASFAYAGNPDEKLRVVERRDETVAYARVVDMEGHEAATEFGRTSDGARELAVLLSSLSPRKSPLVCVAVPDGALRAQLLELGAKIEEWNDPSPMWCVLDRTRLEELAGAPPGLSEESLLRSLVDSAQTVFWPSDRF